mmetsp:Transcript_27087/g.48862  ORF Transcript_27087/g.48862 Transcript_27087/m.48862 type:complete len:119 (+) Transcript_27087:521-877(+)
MHPMPCLPARDCIKSKPAIKRKLLVKKRSGLPPLSDNVFAPLPSQIPHVMHIPGALKVEDCCPGSCAIPSPVQMMSTKPNIYAAATFITIILFQPGDSTTGGTNLRGKVAAKWPPLTA